MISISTNIIETLTTNIKGDARGVALLSIMNAKILIRSIVGWRVYRAIAMLRNAPMEAKAVRRWMQTPQGRTSISRLSMLRNKHKDRRAFIIGNGPSLNKMDLGLLENEVTIASNGIFLAFERMGFVPTYYSIEDPLVAEDRAAEAAAIKGVQRIYPHDLSEVLGGQSAIFVPFRRSYWSFPRFSSELTREAYWGGTVTAFNLQLAFHLGCDTVYLIGCDHNYLVKSDVKKDGARFTSTSDDPNHFDPSYFGKGYRWHDPNVDRMELAYQVCRKVFESDGRAVFNATVGGQLEVFTRVDYETLFEETTKAEEVRVT